MKITKTLIQATADAYTAEEIKQRLKTLLDKVAEGDMYTSVATGDGASYARQVRVPVGDAVELFRAALAYKEHGVLPVTVGLFPVVEP